MTRHTFAFLAASALATSAAPALAQDDELPPLPPLPAEPFEPIYPLADYPEPGYPAVSYSDPGVVEAYGGYPEAPYYAHGLPPIPTASYSWEDRAAWLEDCRAEYYREGEKRGGIIGGLLGAVTGGIIGNRVADGERLGGTLLGAGIGGIAGLAIGAAIGAAADRDEIDECEAYLRRYESRYDHGWTGHAAYPYYPYETVMVPVKIETHYVYSEPLRREKQVVVEEWIDEKVVETKTVSRPSKVIKAKAAANGKTVRSSK